MDVDWRESKLFFCEFCLWNYDTYSKLTTDQLKKKKNEINKIASARLPFNFHVKNHQMTEENHVPFKGHYANEFFFFLFVLITFLIFYFSLFQFLVTGSAEAGVRDFGTLDPKWLQMYLRARNKYETSIWQVLHRKFWMVVCTILFLSESSARAKL